MTEQVIVNLPESEPEERTSSEVQQASLQQAQAFGELTEAHRRMLQEQAELKSELERLRANESSSQERINTLQSELQAVLSAIQEAAAEAETEQEVETVTPPQPEPEPATETAAEPEAPKVETQCPKWLGWMLK